VLGLKFTIEARHGGTVLIDMAALDPRPLAIAAGALRRSAALGDRSVRPASSSSM
jgi:hypothetical protein